MFTTDKEYRSSLWLGICDLYEPHRAAYVLRQCFPGKSNYKRLELVRVDYHQRRKKLEDFIKLFKDDKKIFKFEEDKQSDELFSVPVTDLMPNRFILHANLNVTKGKQYTIWRYGHRLPSQLQVGLDLNHLEVISEWKLTLDD